MIIIRMPSSIAAQQSGPYGGVEASPPGHPAPVAVSRGGGSSLRTKGTWASA
ncbi:MAG: hypothetical protein ABIR47_14275 [Candidatus Kapaibacterium sp.]